MNKQDFIKMLEKLDDDAEIYVHDRKTNEHREPRLTGRKLYKNSFTPWELRKYQEGDRFKNVVLITAFPTKEQLKAFREEDS